MVLPLHAINICIYGILQIPFNDFVNTTQGCLTKHAYPAVSPYDNIYMLLGSISPILGSISHPKLYKIFTLASLFSIFIQFYTKSST